MDILSQYKQDHPEAFREAPRWSPPAEYGFFIRLVMRLSGGKIRDVSTASYALLGVVIVIIIISLFLFLSGGTAKFHEDWKPFVGCRASCLHMSG